MNRALVDDGLLLVSPITLNLNTNFAFTNYSYDFPSIDFLQTFGLEGALLSPNVWQ